MHPSMEFKGRDNIIHVSIPRMQCHKTLTKLSLKLLCFFKNKMIEWISKNIVLVAIQATTLMYLFHINLYQNPCKYRYHEEEAL